HTVANPEGKICAGVLLFLSKMVAHAQYIAGNEEAKQNGALDLLFHHLIKEVYKDVPFFDFGISSQDSNAFLNTGLLFQKEGFGARAVCYDTYKINL
ncbi:MAG: GNAT family N-acetyltransferase, partial [Bacteroidaceae bacterium]|nr:GNAT family N-acetyltransferase [Bacteroidaceae bacterium]